MDERAVRLVAEQLGSLGLAGDAFVAAEIAADLAERSALNATLQDLIDSAEVPPDPTGFRAGWDR